MFSMTAQIILCFARRIWIKLFWVILGCSAVFCALRFLKEMEYGISDPLNLHCLIGIQILFGLTFLILATGIERSNTGFPNRMFVLPANTAFLVFAQMLSGMLAGDVHIRGHSGNGVDNPWNAMAVPWAFIIHCAIPGGEYDVLLVLGPELSIEKVLPAILIWAALLWWIGKRYGIDSMPIHPSTYWTHVTISEWLTIVLLMTGVYGNRGGWSFNGPAGRIPRIQEGKRMVGEGYLNRISGRKPTVLQLNHRSALV